MRKIALSLALVTGVTGVSACSGSSNATSRTLPPVSTSPAADSSPTPVATGINAHTPEGAAAFARYYYAEIEKAFATGDASELRRDSTSACKTCQNYIQSVTDVRKGGGRIGGYRIIVTTAVAPAVTGETARVDVIRNSTESVEYDKNGKVLNRQAGHVGIEEQIDLVRVGGRWQVDKLILIRVGR